MRISDWSSDVCSSDLHVPACQGIQQSRLAGIGWPSEHNPNSIPQALRRRMRLFSDNLRQESFEEQCDLLYRSFRNVILIRKIKLGFHQRGNAEQVHFPNSKASCKMALYQRYSDSAPLFSFTARPKK